MSALDNRALRLAGLPGAPPVARRGHRLREGLGTRERRSRSSGRGTSGSPPPRAWRTSATTSPAPTSTRSGCARSSKGEVPILEEGLPGAGRRGPRLAVACGSSSAPPTRRAAPSSCSSACRRRSGDDGAADLSAVEAVAREIAPVLRPGTVVVNKSTMPVGSTRLVARELSQAGAANDVGVASNPEFLREGTAVRDFLQPSRVVIGCDDAAVAVRVSELYRERAGADPRHRSRVGRDDQVRVERVPRHQDLVHQRDRQPVRGGQRRRARGRARHGLRPAHRLRVPAPRARLRRFVLPEGHRRAHCTPPSSRATTSACCAAWSR